MEAGEIKEVREALRHIQMFWHHDENEIGVKRIGGRTNRVFRIDHGGEQYVLRLAGAGTEAYIDRANEAEAARQAAKAGVSPDVLYTDIARGIMVTRLVDHCTTMSPEKFKAIAKAPQRAGEVLRRLHQSATIFPARFDVFAMIDGYMNVLAAKGAALPEVDKDLARHMAAVRAALSTRELPLAPCHCNPLCENFLDTGKRMWLVDWEYSGMNDPLWDVSNFVVEGGFGPAQEQELLQAYFGGAPADFDVSRIAIYKPMCDVLWALWGLIQHADGNPADNFQSYAMNRLARGRERMASADFTGHLSALARHQTRE